MHVVPLFQYGEFTLHSGSASEFRINAEALDETSIATLAGMIARRVGKFRDVVGIPQGGIPLAAALIPYREGDGPLLVVDDVLTTGRSMEEFRAIRYIPDDNDIIGFVIFDRSGGKRPSWVRALFTLDA